MYLKQRVELVSLKQKAESMGQKQRSELVSLQRNSAFPPPPQPYLNPHLPTHSTPTKDSCPKRQ